MLLPGKLPTDFLKTCITHAGTEDPRVLIGPRFGEDCAVLDMGEQYLVVKTDPVTFTTDDVGWYAVHINANDVATMGARAGLVSSLPPLSARYLGTQRQTGL